MAAYDDRQKKTNLECHTLEHKPLLWTRKFLTLEILGHRDLRKKSRVCTRDSERQCGMVQSTRVWLVKEISASC